MVPMFKSCRLIAGVIIMQGRRILRNFILEESIAGHLDKPHSDIMEIGMENIFMNII